MKILVTGSEGFIGKNLLFYLKCRGYPDSSIAVFNRDTPRKNLRSLVLSSDLVINLAGVNRSTADQPFYDVNVDLVREIVSICKNHLHLIPIFNASSLHAAGESVYGRSKKIAEDILLDYQNQGGSSFAPRLPGIFGKWGRPNYNSFVNTLCYNFSRNIQTNLFEKDKNLSLIYIDDLIENLITWIESGGDNHTWIDMPVYEKSIGDLYCSVKEISETFKKDCPAGVGSGFERALYATYVSYLDKDNHVIPLDLKKDARGIFCELVKTADSGQFCFFTCRPGEVRGGHVHNTKLERFFVLSGVAKFTSVNCSSGETFELTLKPYQNGVVSAPGWRHTIQNIGDSDLICALWVNEKFNSLKPDTFHFGVE